MIALYWIKNNKEWNIWVQNRVGIIDKFVKPDNWHYISSSDNPADRYYQGVSTKFDC